MSDAATIWREKSDDELRHAAQRLEEYTADGEAVIRAELRRRGFAEPSPTVERLDDAGASVSNRYSDAYRLAATIIGLGTVVKVVGAFAGAGIALVGLASSEQLGIRGVLGGVILGLIAAFLIWVAGVFISAQGQLVSACLDTAINSSPLLSDAEKARVMGVKNTSVEV